MLKITTTFKTTITFSFYYPRFWRRFSWFIFLSLHTRSICIARDINSSFASQNLYWLMMWTYIPSAQKHERLYFTCTTSFNNPSLLNTPPCSNSQLYKTSNEAVIDKFFLIMFNIQYLIDTFRYKNFLHYLCVLNCFEHMDVQLGIYQMQCDNSYFIFTHPDPIRWWISSGASSRTVSFFSYASTLAHCCVAQIYLRPRRCLFHPHWFLESEFTPHNVLLFMALFNTVTTLLLMYLGYLHFRALKTKKPNIPR